MTIEQRLALLERAVGDFTTRAEMANPPAELENGEYPILFRQRQLGLAVDQAVKLVSDFATANANLQARVAALEAKQSGDVQVPPAPGDIPADLAGAVLNVLRNAPSVRIDGTLALGGDPRPNSHAQIHIHGGLGAAHILGISNETGNDKQNPNEVHESEFVISDTDGGIRAIQYGRFFNGKIRNTTNRPMSIFALFDSMGDTCVSDDRIPHGQIWYIVKRIGERFVDFCTYQVGHRPRLMAAQGEYAANDVDVIAERIEAAFRARGL